MSRRVAIVTGSESGIGRASAVALAQAGLDVGITWFQDEAAGRETATRVERAGGRAAVRQVDVTRTAETAEAIDAFADELGGLDVFVSNAGVGTGAPALEVTEAELRASIDTNLVGAFFASQAAARRMLAAGTQGRIVNITSVHEHVPLRNAAAYTIAKHGLGGATKSLALELAPHGISVNSIAPGEITAALADRDDAAPRVDSRIPMGRAGRPEDVAGLVVHLACDAPYTTGSSFVLDGGMLLTVAVDYSRPAPDSDPPGGVGRYIPARRK